MRTIMTPHCETIGVAQLWHGDCADVLPLLGEPCADLIVTDPPYFAVANEAWDYQWDDAACFIQWLSGVVALLSRAMRVNASLYLFASPKMAARVEVMVREHLCVLNHIVWRKTTGHWQKAERGAMRAYFPQTERIVFAEHYGADAMAMGVPGYKTQRNQLRAFVFEPLRAYLADEWKRAGLTIKDADTATHSSMGTHYLSPTQWSLPSREKYEQLRAYANQHGQGTFLDQDHTYLVNDYDTLHRDYETLRALYEELRRPFLIEADTPNTDVWDFHTTATSFGRHPCEKPLPLMNHIVSVSSKRGGMVLDAFMGSGSAGIAAVTLGRRFIGIERDALHFEDACQRIEDAQRQGSLFTESALLAQRPPVEAATGGQNVAGCDGNL